MRTAPLLLLAGALALLLPGASAFGIALEAQDAPSADAEVPDQRIMIDGQHVAVDSAEVHDEGPTVEGGVETDDTEVVLAGPRCHVDLDAGDMQGPADACHGADVRTNAHMEMVRTSFDVRIEEAVAQESAATSDLQAASAAIVASPTVTVMLAAAAAGVSAAMLVGLWRLLKWTGLAAFIPLYSHISDDQILDDANRAGIYRLIQTEAGIATKDIADRLGLAWGTVTHHLNKLEKRRFVVSKKYGKYRRYFANGEGGTEKKDAVAVLRLDRTGDIAALIRERPGLTQKEVSGLLGVSSSTILWHVKRLEKVQLVNKVRDGKQVRYYPGEGLAAVQIITPPVSVA